ncbi:MAG: Ribonuclease Y, partial [uncultured Gemmatimonadetes bacterium]
DDGFRRGAAVGRDEGPHHRPRGAQHPRVRAGHGDRRHHRRHPRSRGAFGLRSHPPRNRPHRPGKAGGRRAHPPGPHRRRGRQGAPGGGEGDARGRRGDPVRAGDPRRAPRDRQGAGAFEVPHLVRAEPAAARQGSGHPGRQHGLGDGLRRHHGQADGAASRRGQGDDPRPRGHPRGAGLQPVQEVRRAAAGAERHQGAPRRGAAPVSRVVPGHRGRRHQRLAAGCPPRDVRNVRQAAGKAGGDRHVVPGGGALLRHPGGPRAAGDGDPRGRFRRGDVAPERGHGAAHRGRAAVPGADQGGGDPRDAGDRLRAL